MVVILALISGLIFSCAFSPIAFWFCAPIAISILIFSLQKLPLARRLLVLYSFGCISNALVLHWTSTYVGALPWIILTGLESLFLLPIAVIFPLQKWRYLALPSLWVFMEFLMSHLPFGGFGWTRIAFTQADSPYRVLASLAGAPALTFLSVTAGIALYKLAKMEVMKSVGIFLAIAVLVSITSTTTGSSGEESIGRISILGVQGGVPALGLDFNARAEEVFHNHLAQTYLALASIDAKPDLIVWPENAVDVDPFKNLKVRSEINTLVTRRKIPLVFGAVREFHDGYQNVSVLWRPDTGPDSIYTKIHLTPFGEYIPLRNIARIVSPLVDDVVDFMPGKALTVHKVKSASVGPIICYELIDDSLLRRVAAKSNIFVIQTNNATFGTSAQSDQQLAISRIRAIEHHRNILSISTSGISAFIDTDGNLSQKTSLNTAGYISSRVELFDNLTIADRLGSWGEWMLILLPCPIWFIVSRMKRVFV